MSNFSNEIEKGEAKVFKAYIQLAIAKFAEVYSSPSPHHIPRNTRPTHEDIIGRDKITVTEVTIALPQKPIGVVIIRGVAEGTPCLSYISRITENTWATVACAGQKKARVLLNNSTQVYPKGRQSHRPANKGNSKIIASQSMALSDKKLFVRLLQEHEWRKLSPMSI